MNFLFSRKKNKRDMDLLIKNGKLFIGILSNIRDVLNQSNNSAQGMIVDKSIEELKTKEYDMFIESVNSINFWGGSGAVWEVHIESKTQEKDFTENMIQLIELMENTKILKRKIKSIKNIFKSNL